MKGYNKSLILLELSGLSVLGKEVENRDRIKGY